MAIVSVKGLDLKNTTQALLRLINENYNRRPDLQRRVLTENMLLKLLQKNQLDTLKLQKLTGVSEKLVASTIQGMKDAAVVPTQVAQAFRVPQADVKAIRWSHAIRRVAAVTALPALDELSDGEESPVFVRRSAVSPGLFGDAVNITAKEAKEAQAAAASGESKEEQGWLSWATGGRLG